MIRALVIILAFALSAAALAQVPAELPGAEPFADALRARLKSALEAEGPDYEPRSAWRDAKGAPRYTNRLLLEPSPYLRQHAHNPVDWRPWGDAAFADAQRLKRPVFVSIGYSTCHWCHVMEEESFDDPNVARFLNEHFVAIKVDREARPDVDSIYMKSVQALGQRGGWPLNVWLTPDREPFYGGTYFPPQDQGERPGFLSVLRNIHKSYSENPERMRQYAAEFARKLRDTTAAPDAETSRIPTAAALSRAVGHYGSAFDAQWGGVGSGTKFPSRLPIRFLLRYQRRTGDAQALAMATRTLDAMASGGLRDHVGGGFHRYSTDPRWLVPHFEKMLYDNALLVPAYLDGLQVSGRPEYARVVHETLRFVSRELTAPDGAFYSALDADSPGPDGEMEEGWFYTWTPAELEAVLGAQRAAAFQAYYGVTPAGNHEGRTVLHAWRALPDVAQEVGAAPDALSKALQADLQRLYAARAKRPAPLRDEKILAAWNGLMISAFARAGLVLAEPDYVARARKAALAVLEHQRDGQRLLRVRLGGAATGPAFLDDYAFLIAGLLDLYEADPDPRWIREAGALQQAADQYYADAEGGGYYVTANDHEKLLMREKPAQDAAVPAGNSTMALNLLRLYDLTQDGRYLEGASLLFSAFHDTLTQNPTLLGEMLLALDYELDKPKEIVIVTPADGSDPTALLDALRRTFVPNRTLSVVEEGEELAAHAKLVPLIAGKAARDGRATAYVCEDRVCAAPTADPTVFAKQISRVRTLDAP